MRTIVGASAAALLIWSWADAQSPAPLPCRVEEATIAQIHDAIKTGRLTCRALGAEICRQG